VSKRVPHHFFWVLVFALGVVVFTIGLFSAFSTNYFSTTVTYPSMYAGIAISIIGLLITIFSYYQINYMSTNKETNPNK
jgi:hypothetical protein